MSDVGQIERKTQNRAVDLFRDPSRLAYDYGGNREDWDNRNIDVPVLEQNLKARGYDDELVRRAVKQLTAAASLGAGQNLYDANRKFYELLRYGVKIKRDVGETTETVWPIDWSNPGANHFMVAEEVTIKGEHTKRPDVVIYVNGMALGVTELKRSWVSVSEGIRQNIGNQKQHFVRPFFTTVQLLFAGNDVEGLRYGVIDTPEKYWLEWREPGDEPNPLDQALLQMCSKERFLELIHDFIVFDSGVKKVARHNQYFGVKAAQERVRSHDGGIIWHTQGSGKSLTMVWLAKWIRENQDDARVLIITDRTELDDQIEEVFGGVNESIYRASSGADLIETLGKSQPWLVASLVHKFRAAERDDESDDGETDAFIAELGSSIPADWKAKGNLFVFVDEAHRTQSGKLHKAMTTLLPNAMFIGFTGTPLLKADKMTSIETFGSFIHTYKFDEAVRDGVVLDLRYTARNIDQQLVGREAVDKWFDVKTKGLTDLSKARLKRKWGTIQKVVSARSRASMIVQDILMDFEREPRLVSGRGNAMLVSESVYQACKFYEMFAQAGFKDKVAIVSSYVPSATAISKEDAGAGANEELMKYDIYRQMLSDYFQEPADKAVLRIDEFETEVKRRFVKEPGQMRLLIVVDKLLTGFDAPSATYLYIDKSMQDHGLFQAICRVNRLDGEDKTYGYVVDYRDLFKSLDKAIHDYTAGALDGYAKEDIDGLLKDRTEQDRKDLDEALEKVRALCEPVAPPKGTVEYQHYFVSKVPGDAEQIKENEPKRIQLYKSVASLVRSYATLANDMEEAGYSASEALSIKKEVAHFVAVRNEVERGAGENIDMKQFEAGMRSLLDTYILAEPSENVATLQKGLVELIVERGDEAIDTLPKGIKDNKEAVAETIINNVRKTIVDERALNPKYYDQMSALLDAIIEKRREQADEYADYLQDLLDLTTKVGNKESDRVYPAWVTSPAQRAFADFDWPEGYEAQLEHISDFIQSNKDHGWVGNPMKERALKRVLRRELPNEFSNEQLDDLVNLLKEHDEYR
ncbi:type I restriction endonuclease subunit R [Schaalia sp. JY-X169]|uniref:type I restriction endonuclease subunit R n=1 Tax=Schaalia sp. JY-X169 TaxID=2758572 RepID=UPI0015F38491|nr:type I restriction endonuclease subunit R [Schaalia sp. JY-X169]